MTNYDDDVHYNYGAIIGSLIGFIFLMVIIRMICVRRWAYSQPVVVYAVYTDEQSPINPAPPEAYYQQQQQQPVYGQPIYSGQPTYGVPQPPPPAPYYGQASYQTRTGY